MLNLEKYLLVKIGEEASEVIKASSKALIHGMNDRNPASGKENRHEIAGEVHDTLCIADMLDDLFHFRSEEGKLIISGHYTPIGSRADQKQCRVAIFALHSIYKSQLTLDPLDKAFLHGFFDGYKLDYCREFLAGFLPEQSHGKYEYYREIRDAAVHVARSMFEIELVPKQH